jgi:hypothetical protein
VFVYKPAKFVDNYQQIYAELCLLPQLEEDKSYIGIERKEKKIKNKRSEKKGKSWAKGRFFGSKQKENCKKKQGTVNFCWKTEKN